MARGLVRAVGSFNKLRMFLRNSGGNIVRSGEVSGGFQVHWFS